jgi:hypothetical protein
MLRPPPLFGDLDETLAAVVEAAEARDVPVMCSERFMDAAAGTIRDTFGFDRSGKRRRV